MDRRSPPVASRLLALALAATLSGCAATGPGVPHDPWEGFNRSMFQFNDTLDRAILKPTAEAYRDTVPGVVRTGVSNFFNNLDDIVVVVNDILQLKLATAVRDTARLFINTTIGLYGLIDIAGLTGLEKRNEDFGQTLGRYGIGPGPYLVLPFFGPRTLRDSTALVAVDPAFNAVYAIEGEGERAAAIALNVVSTRANLLSASSVADAAALDPYVFLREAYLQQRANLVRDGAPPPGDQRGGEGGDPLDDLDDLDELDEIDQIDALDALEAPAAQ